MNHRMIKPPSHLQQHVRYFWTLDSYGARDEKTLLKIFACRFPRLVFQHDNGVSAFSKESEKLPIAFLCGINIKPYTSEMSGTFSLTGVSFFPHALKSIFGIDSHEICDEFPDLENFIPKELIERIFETQRQSLKINLLANYLTKRLNNNPLKDIFILKNLELLSHAKESNHIDALQKHLHISERHLERKFREIMGLSPKQYLRIERFERAFDLMQSKEDLKLYDVAYDLDYTDQSHFTRDFKDLSGLSPKLFLQKEKILEESSSIVIKN